MTTKLSGGRITGVVALTCQAQVATAVGDFVHVTGPYEVALADGTKPIIGYVSVKNSVRVGPTRTAEVPGDVTVEARGWGVKKHNSGAAITAGAEVGIDGTGALVAVGTGVAKVGIALMAATGAGQAIDVLIQ